jgi:hypothetical protein
MPLLLLPTPLLLSLPLLLLLLLPLASEVPNPAQICGTHTRITYEQVAGSSME